MSRTVAFFDIDGVVYDGHTIFDVIQAQENVGFLKKGLYQKILTDLAFYKSGKETYEQAANSMLQNYATALKGKKYSLVFENTYNFLMERKNKFFNYVPKTLVALQKSHDIYLVSTNFQFIVEAVAKVLGLNKFLSSKLKVVDGVLTGKVTSSLAGSKGVVKEVIKNYSFKGSIAIGDSENDIAMLESVKSALVFEPNEKMTQIALSRKWVVVTRKNAYTHILDLI